MEQALNDFIGGKHGAVPVNGYLVTQEHIRVQNNDALFGINRNHSSEENADLFHQITDNAYNSFSLSPDVQLAIIDTTKPYADYHYMLLACRTQGDSPFIGSINDVSSSELATTFSAADRMMDMYEKDANEKLITAISINFHENPLKDPNLPKSWAQTLPALHVHVTGIRLNQLGETIPSRKLERREAIDTFDPMTLLAEQLVGIPSIHESLLDGLTHISKDVVNLRTGMEFTINSDRLGNESVAAELQLLQSRFHDLYNQISNLFVDQSNLDAIGMPTLREDRDDLITQFIQQLSENPKNSSHTQLMKLSENMHRWSSLMLPGDHPDVISGKKPLFLRSFADTMTIIRDPAHKSLKLIMAPRILSIGNMVASLGFIKVPFNELKPVDAERITQLERMEPKLKQLSVSAPV